MHWQAVPNCCISGSYGEISVIISWMYFTEIASKNINFIILLVMLFDLIVNLEMHTCICIIYYK